MIERCLRALNKSCAASLSLGAACGWYHGDRIEEELVDVLERESPRWYTAHAAMRNGMLATRAAPGAQLEWLRFPVHNSCAPFDVVAAWAHVADHVEEVFTWASVPADFIMVGLPGTGTTSLHSTLASHADIAIADREIALPGSIPFDPRDWSNRLCDSLITRADVDALANVSSAPRSAKPIRILHSVHMGYSSACIKNVRRTGATAVFTVRDPFDWVWSAFRDGLREAGWTGAITIGHTRNLHKHANKSLHFHDPWNVGRVHGLASRFIQRALALIGESSVLVIEAIEHLQDPTTAVLMYDSLFKRMGIRSFHEGGVQITSNNIRRRRVVPKLQSELAICTKSQRETYDLLRRYCAPEYARLERLLWTNGLPLPVSENLRLRRSICVRDSADIAAYERDRNRSANEVPARVHR
jgi:hypothetical protein